MFIVAYIIYCIDLKAKSHCINSMENFHIKKRVNSYF